MLTKEQIAALESACGLLAGLGKWDHARTIRSMLREQLFLEDKEVKESDGKS